MVEKKIALTAIDLVEVLAQDVVLGRAFVEEDLDHLERGYLYCGAVCLAGSNIPERAGELDDLFALLPVFHPLGRAQRVGRRSEQASKPY